MNSQRIAIALFKGTSLISKLIKWFTWSDYSHVAVIFVDDFMVYESWDGVGVIKNTVSDLGKAHKKGTQVDLFRFVMPITAEECVKMRDYAESRLGMKYDYMGILGFIMRKVWHSENRVFCSEYVLDVLRAGGHNIINQSDYKVPPKAFAETIALEKYGGFIIT